MLQICFYDYYLRSKDLLHYIHKDFICIKVPDKLLTLCTSKLRKYSLRLVRTRLKNRLYYRFLKNIFILSYSNLFIFRLIYFKLLYFWGYLSLLQWYSFHNYLVFFFLHYRYNYALIKFFDNQHLYFFYVKYNDYVVYDSYNLPVNYYKSFGLDELSFTFLLF